jgi:hypothetical protein
MILASALPTVATAQIAEIINSSGDGTNPLDFPNITADAAGNVFVVGINTNNGFRIAASTTCSTGGTPCSITEIIDDTGDGTGDINAGTGNYLDRAAAVVTDASGNVYVVGQFSDNVFRILNPTTCSTGGTPCDIAEIIDTTGDGTSALEVPFSIAIDSSGNLYVGGASSDNVFRIAASTTCSTSGTPCTITEILDSTGDGSGNASDQPSGVAVDASGNVFVTHQNSDNVFKIATPTTCSASGTPCTITEILDSTGDGLGNVFGFGRGIVADSSGNVYASAIGFGAAEPPRIFRIDTPGTCSTVGTPCTVTEVAERLLPQQSSGMVVDAGDNVFVAGGNGDDALRLDTPTSCSTGGTPCTITTIIDATGDGVAILDGPGQVAAAGTSAFVAGGGSDNVFRINSVADDGAIFSDGFESGDTSQWSAVSP